MRFATAVLDALFPPRCAACREPLPPADQVSRRGALCVPCDATLDPINSACLRCGLPGPVSDGCESCKREPQAFDTAQAPYLYGAAIAQMLHRYKYEDSSHLAVPLGEAVARLPLPPVDVVVPVPLHPQRRRARTYDQALYLAQVVARLRGWPCDYGTLIRARSTERQVGQHRGERLQNVSGAFRVTSETLRGKRVLLIDDVVTTGATASTCAKVLKEGGVRSVHVASAARAI